MDSIISRMAAGLVASDVAELAFADPSVTMSVRAFSVREGLDRTFEVLVTAASPSPDLDFETIVGRGAAFRLAATGEGIARRVWSGVCREVEQLSVEEGGLSIYLVRVVPMLWRLSQRTNRRLFQHQSSVEIACAILGEWGIEPELRIQGVEFPRHELRTQLDESDLAFVSRQLEEAGISFWFEQGPPVVDGGDVLEPVTLVLGVEPQRAAPRHVELPFRARSEHVDAEAFVRDVRVSRSSRAGRVSLRGHDFRASPELSLLFEAQAAHELESRYERYRFAPKAFWSESAVGDTRGATLDDRLAAQAATIDLERERTGRLSVRFTTNVLDLEPGCVVTLAGHPRHELVAPHGLLVVGAELQGEVGGDWSISIEATPTREPYRPSLATPRPRALGLESAIVVGPDGSEGDVHTDEYGRVKVRFPWDREGKNDDRASSWLRVSEAWAGSGHGMVNLPRVGSEVLVGFFEGDPDRPLVVGRAYHRTGVHPYALPENRTKSVWRSRSVPGGDGYNELSFEDRSGEEVVHLRAERDLEVLARNDERTSVGANRTTTVRRNDRHVVGGAHSFEVRGDQAVRVKGRRTEFIEGGVDARSGARTGITMEDGKIVISNGQASIVLDGPIVRIDAVSNVWVRSGRLVAVSSKQVTIDKDVSIAEHDLVPPDVSKLAPPAEADQVSPPPGGSEPAPHPKQVSPVPGNAPPGGVDEAKFDAMKFYEDLLAKGGVKVKLPKNLPLPPAINEQLQHYAKVGHKIQVVHGVLVDPATYEAMKARLAERLEAEKARLIGIGDSIRSTFEKNRDHLQDLGKTLSDRFDLEKANLAKLRGDLSDIFSGKHGGFLESCKALYGVFKEQRAHLLALRDDVVALIEAEKKWLSETVGEWKAIGAEIQSTLDGYKNLVENPKDAVLDIVLGPDKQLGKDLTALADEVGLGDEAAKFFGVEAPSLKSGGAPSIEFGAPSGMALAPLASGQGLPSASVQAALGGALGTPGSAGSPVTLAPQATLAQAGVVGVLGGGTVTSRAGGLAAADVARSVGPQQLAFLQSPAEGQRMVIPTERALALDPEIVKHQLVEAQLHGKAAGTAMNELLQSNGYTVYERAWGDYSGAFAKVAGAAAGA